MFHFAGYDQLTPTKCQISGFHESLVVFAGYNSGCALQNVSRLPFLYMHPKDEQIWRQLKTYDKIT